MTTTTATPKIEIRVQPASSRACRQCLVCGGLTDMDGAIAAVFEDGKRTRFVVCPGPTGDDGHPGCLGQSREVIAERLRARAQQVREAASELEAWAADPPPIPTREAWQKANEEVERMEREAFQKANEEFEGLFCFEDEDPEALERAYYVYELYALMEAEDRDAGEPGDAEKP